MKKVLLFIKKNSMGIFILLAILLKLILVNGLPVNALPFARHDDALMLEMAEHFLHNQWMGEYGNSTLIKGAAFPLFLAVNSLLGIPYLNAVVILYAAACGLLVWTLRKQLKTKFLCGLLFVTLFFSPINASSQTLLRIYRNSIAPALTLFVFAFFIGLYLNRKSNYMALWSVGAGFSAAAMWNLREDSIWILPFVLMVSIVTMVALFFDSKQQGVRRYWKKFAWVILPFALCSGINGTIAAINYQTYGVYTRLELEKGNFPKMMKSIYAVASEEDIPQVSVPKNTVDQLYKASPTFARLQQQLDANYGAGWDLIDGSADGQIKDGWFFWCLRDCIANIGCFDTASEMELFCGQVSEEINAALGRGQLPKRKGMTMPSALMSPWKDRYLVELPQAIYDVFWYVAKNEGCELATREAQGTWAEIRKIEEITHNFAVYPNQYNLLLNGWIASEDDNKIARAAIYHGDNLIATLRPQSSTDIEKSYKNNGMVLKNTQNCRFNEVLSVPAFDNLFFVVLMEGNEVSRTPLNEAAIHESGKGYQWHIDSFQEKMNADIIKESAEPRIALLNAINNVYREYGQLFTIMGLCSYAIITFLLLQQLFQKKYELLNEWLISTSLLLSSLVLIAGVAYTHISAYPAIANSYLAGAYTLIPAFEILNISFLWNLFKTAKAKKTMKRFLSSNQ